MKKYIYLFFASLAILSFSSCEVSSVDPLDTSFASFISNTMDIGVEAGSEISKEVEIYTTNITNTDRSISVLVVAESTDADAAAYSIPSTVTIPSGTNVGSLKIDIKDVGLSEDKVLVIRLQSTEETSTGDPLTISLSQLCPNNGIKVKINLSFDGWPEEAAWRILDSDNNTVIESTTPFNYGAYAGMTDPLTIKECLPSGTYTIEIYDAYEDGGTDYEVTANGILVFSATGNYGAGKTGTFTI
jgi:hypothetical protein